MIIRVENLDTQTNNRTEWIFRNPTVIRCCCTGLDLPQGSGPTCEPPESGWDNRFRTVSGSETLEASFGEA
jgi:hypothetical protein